MTEQCQFLSESKEREKNRSPLYNNENIYIFDTEHYSNPFRREILKHYLTVLNILKDSQKQIGDITGQTMPYIPLYNYLSLIQWKPGIYFMWPLNFIYITIYL